MMNLTRARTCIGPDWGHAHFNGFEPITSRYPSIPDILRSYLVILTVSGVEPSMASFRACAAASLGDSHIPDTSESIVVTPSCVARQGVPSKATTTLFDSSAH